MVWVAPLNGAGRQAPMPGAGRVGMMGAHRRGLVVLAAIITIALLFSMSAECLAGDDYTWVRQNPLPEGVDFRTF